MKRITVIGAGNGGQAYAGYCAAKGYEVCLYNRNIDKLGTLREKKEIRLTGRLNYTSSITTVTDNIKDACEFGDIVLIVTPATAHRQLATEMGPFVRNGQSILLNPGRTLGTVEFETELTRHTNERINIGESQTLAFACRIIENGTINIIGVKDHVPVACSRYNNIDTIFDDIFPIFHCFEKEKSLLKVGFDNIGSIFHPAVVLFNAATIERQDSFYFYRDMTPQIASVIEALDNERIRIGKSYGYKLMPVCDWIKYAYPTTIGNSLCERMRNNPGYHDIKAPGTIFTRQLTEDIPTGLLPMRELGKLAGICTPIMDSIITLVSTLLGIDFSVSGRTLKNLGLDGMSKSDIINTIG